MLGSRNCGEAWGVLLKPVAADRARVQSATGWHVLARPGAIDGPAASTVGQTARKLSPAERAAIAALLEQARRNTIDGVRQQQKASSSRGPRGAIQRAWTGKWQALDQALDRHTAALTFDATTYRLTPDGDPRVFVRARWTVNGDVAYALAAWVRLSAQPAVESVDTTPARTMRIVDEGVHEWESAIPKVFEVFDLDGDGRAEVLVRREGYENLDYALIEYPSSPGEKPRELADYGDGC